MKKNVSKSTRIRRDVDYYVRLCTSPTSNENYIQRIECSVLENISYKKIRSFLEDGESNNKWQY